MQWINYVFKGIALLLGYSLKASKREIERTADKRADEKFGVRQ